MAFKLGNFPLTRTSSAAQQYVNALSLAKESDDKIGRPLLVITSFSSYGDVVSFIRVSKVVNGLSAECLLVSAQQHGYIGTNRGGSLTYFSNLLCAINTAYERGILPGDCVVHRGDPVEAPLIINYGKTIEALRTISADDLARLFAGSSDKNYCIYSCLAVNIISMLFAARGFCTPRGMITDETLGREALCKVTKYDGLEQVAQLLEQAGARQQSI